MIVDAWSSRLMEQNYATAPHSMLTVIHLLKVEPGHIPVSYACVSWVKYVRFTSEFDDA